MDKNDPKFALILSLVRNMTDEEKGHLWTVLNVRPATLMDGINDFAEGMKLMASNVDQTPE